MKKLLLTTGLVSGLLMSASAMAEVKVGGSIEMNYGSTETATTATKNSGPGSLTFETELDISSTKELDNGMTLGLHMEMMDSTLGDIGMRFSSGNTTFYMGTDDMSAADSYAVPVVGDLLNDTLINGNSFDGNKGTVHGYSAFGLEFKDIAGGKITALYAPTGSSGNGSDGTIGQLASSGSAYEVGYNGNAGVDGLTVQLAYANNQSADATSTAGDATVTQIGAAYNFGSIAVGAQYNDFEGADPRGGSNDDDEEHTGMGVTFAVNDQITLGAEMTKVEFASTSLTSDEEGRSIGVGYNLGGVSVTAQLLEVQNSGGTANKDSEAFMIRIKQSF
jgi:hypothetical protein